MTHPSDTSGSPAPATGWIQSPVFDLPLLLLTPIAGLILLGFALGLGYGQKAVTLGVYLIGIPHYLSSFTFYGLDENRAYYRARWLAFFAGPVLIFAAVLGLRALNPQWMIAQSILFVWNIYHVSQQNAGMLSLYRRLNGGDQRERRPAHLFLLSTAATMAFWYVDRFPPLHQQLTWLHPSAPIFLRTVCALTAFFSGWRYLLALAAREKSIAAPEWCMLLCSLLLFHPYLWVQDSNLATTAMLMGHFVQYLAILWLLHRRRIAEPAGSVAQKSLFKLSHHTMFLLFVFAAVGTSFWLFSKASERFGFPMTYVVIWNALTLIHFYVDGLVWAFKDPFVRRTVGSYLTPAPSPSGVS